MKIEPEDKMWRTLVRIHKVNANGIFVVIPGWNINKPVFCPKKAIPPHLFKSMKIIKRYHVGCNIGQEKAKELCFDGWEE